MVFCLRIKWYEKNSKKEVNRKIWLDFRLKKKICYKIFLEIFKYKLYIRLYFGIVNYFRKDNVIGLY